jgi:hypothetical protein
LVDFISKFCNTGVCSNCSKKKRRNPEDLTQFLRICTHCEDLFLRKNLFEKFWNEKVQKEKKIAKKKQKLKDLIERIEIQKEQNRVRERKKSELQMSTHIIEGMEDKIVGISHKIKMANERENSLVQQQFKATERIVNENNTLKQKEELLQTLYAKKDFYKANQIKNLHRKQDLQLKVKFFLEKTLEKHQIDIDSIMNTTESNFDQSNDNIQVVERISDIKGALSKKEKQKLLKKKKKYKDKNTKLVNTSSTCGGCQKCRIF